MHRLKTLLLNIGHAFHEACVCLLLGLRSSLRVGILLRSSLLCLLMFLFTTWLFYAYFQEIGFVSAGIGLFAAAGGVLLGLLPVLPTTTAAGIPGMVTVVAPLINTLLPLLLYAAGLTVVVMGLLYVGLLVLGIRLSLRWVLMDSLRDRALRRYRQLEPAAHSPRGAEGLVRGMRYSVTPWLGLGAGPFLCLLLPVVSGPALVALLCYLNVRFLLPAALGPLAGRDEQLRVLRAQRGALAWFGLLILVIACIPPLNLLTPALLGAGTCHLGYRGLEQVRRNAGALPPAPVSLPPAVPTAS